MPHSKLERIQAGAIAAFLLLGLTAMITAAFSAAVALIFAGLAMVAFVVLMLALFA